MNTKERILQAALQLYNTHGIYSITSRHIAKHMNISAGNLHYHFKHTDDILIALYEQLSAEFDKLMFDTQSIEEIETASLDVFSEMSFKIIYKYRFIFLHFVEIGQRIPAIRMQYQKLVERRTNEFKTIFQRCIEKGIFRSDLTEEVWDKLVTQVFIVADFWLSSNELTNRYKGPKALQQFKETIQNIFIPYIA